MLKQKRRVGLVGTIVALGSTAIALGLTVGGSLWLSRSRPPHSSEHNYNRNGETRGVLAKRPFSSGSFWNTALPQTTLIDPESPAYVQNIARQLHNHGGNVGINTTSYSPPVYTVDAATAKVAVNVDDCQHKGYLDKQLVQQFAAVPVPVRAVQSNGSDGEMVVWQPSTDTLWDFWRASQQDGQWSVCWGGRLTNVSTSQGVFPWPFGTTATGLPLLGGLIRIGELQAGEIDHVIAMSLVDTRKGLFSWPAMRTDGASPLASSVPEGQRFRLDPDINVEALPLSPAGKVVASAIQRYGLVIRDHAGGVTLYGENPSPLMATGQPDPYLAMFGKFSSDNVLAGFPWNKLQALPFDYGKP